MKITHPLRAKIRLFLIVLTLCILIVCIFLLIIHPEAWIAPVCAMIVAGGILLYQLFWVGRKVKI